MKGLLNFFSDSWPLFAFIVVTHMNIDTHTHVCMCLYMYCLCELYTCMYVCIIQAEQVVYIYLFSLYDVICMNVFKADYLLLDIQLVCPP